MQVRSSALQWKTGARWVPGALLLAALAMPLARAHAQTPASTPSPTQTSHAPLTVDSDPVSAPDPAAGSAAALSEPPHAGVVTREDGKFTLRTDAYEVRLNASVVDSSGHTVDSLPQDAFKVYEDGVPQTIIGFKHEDLPVSLGLLIDNSGSMYDKSAAVDAAALNLVKLSNPQDEAFLVDFSSEAYIDQEFTSSIAKLQQGLSYIKPGGGTALYDAVVASADYLAKGAKHPKQVLLIITDGEDNASGLTLEQTIRRVQDLGGPIVYCIGLLFGDDGGAHEARQAKRALQLLSEETGGIAYFPRSLNDVDAIAGEVAQDIRSQYTLGYHSTKPVSFGGYRAVRVLARATGSKKNLNVRTRSGYFPKTSTPGVADPQMSTGSN
jgi:Ca-activated chloride channel family protein